MKKEEEISIPAGIPRFSHKGEDEDDNVKKSFENLMPNFFNQLHFS